MSNTPEVVSKKNKLDDLIKRVDYRFLNSNLYVPSTFALEFMNFIKLVNGKEGESHKTPPMHLKMLDILANDEPWVVNLLFRGAAKTSVFLEYLALYLAVFGSLPHLGKVSGMIYVSDSIDNGVKNARQSLETRYNNSDFLQEWIPEAKFTDKYIEFISKDGNKLGIKLYGAATGIRGSKIFGKRPVLAILDDLIGDADAVSKASMDAIKDTVYKGVMNAMDPSNNKIIFNGTPFAKEDIIVEAVESGAWAVNVFPMCEKFPCTEEEFSGAWPDRFSYKNMMSLYEKFELADKVGSFYQELMLQITNTSDRLVSDNDILWFDSQRMLENRNNFNFYITTDFATSAKQSADYSVISVWAYNNNGDWFWVDGFAEKTTMDITIANLFRLAQMYKPLSVGIETNGQQGGFVSWIQSEMLHKNIWFNLAAHNGSVGIRRSGDKLVNFNYVVPLFKAKKMYFPSDKKEYPVMQIFLDQIKLALRTGFKGKDDFIDTISMLPFMDAIRPSSDIMMNKDPSGIWAFDEPVDTNNLSSYIV